MGATVGDGSGGELVERVEEERSVAAEARGRRSKVDGRRETVPPGERVELDETNELERESVSCCLRFNLVDPLAAPPP